MNYKELRKLDLKDYIEKKNNLAYLSWSWAVDFLLQQDSSAVWDFPEPKMFGETMMVYCDVTAFGKTIKMHLPVMDYRNQAIKNPTAVDINKAMMRCLAKGIACFGIGLYIYSGEDLPSDSNETTVTPVTPKETPKPVVKPEPVKVEPKPITGQKGEFQIVAPGVPESELDVPAWLDLIKQSAKVLLMTASTEEDVMHIFKKNKVLFDAVKTTDAVFFKELMALFTEAKNQLVKE
jgi:hypothetical protein